MNIRPFAHSERDYQGMAEIKWAVWPEYRRTVDELRAFDETWDPDCFLYRRLAEVDGQLVGLAECFQPPWTDRPGRYVVWVDVHPTWQRRGIGSALYAVLLDLRAPHQPRTLITGTREDQHGALRFLQRHGFRQVARHPESWLEVRSFDPAPFARVLEKVQTAGVEIHGLPALQARDPDWKRKWWELHGLLLQDVPANAPLINPSLEAFSQRLSLPSFLPEGCFFALAGDAYVGVTSLSALPSDPRLLLTDLSGVVRSHRRLGIATALKLHAIDFARRRGAERILTGNEENNPMYDLNLKLGFRPGSAMLDYDKVLDPA